MSIVDPMDLIIMVMYMLVLVTVLGNILVLVSILTQDKTRAVRSNKFLVSLACADLCVGIFVMLPSILKIQAGSWSWGPTPCKIWVTLDVFFCSASIYSLIGISLDRFYAIYKPLNYAIEKTHWCVYFLIGFAWLMACIISFPMYIRFNKFSNWTRTVEKNFNACSTPAEPSSKGWVLFAGILAFILPMLILTTLYIAIGLRMRKRQSGKITRAKTNLKMAVRANVWKGGNKVEVVVNTPQDELQVPGCIINPDSGFQEPQVREISVIGLKAEQINVDPESMTSYKETDIDETRSGLKGLQGLQEHEIKQLMVLEKIGVRKTKHLSRAEKKLRSEEKVQTKITIMMGVIIGSFAACWTPFAVMFFAAPFSLELGEFLEKYEAVTDTITWIGYLNSCINPIIYASMNTEIRNGMVKFLCPMSKM